MAPSLPPPLEGNGFSLDGPATGRLACYAGRASEGAPLLLLHSVNAAASAFEVRPLFEHYEATRPTYALDLPGYGLSERSARPYTIRLMTDAVHAIVAEIGRRHGGARVDALALSLASEYLARAAHEAPSAFRSLALVSPTGFNGARRREGPEGSARAVPGMLPFLSTRLWADALFRSLTRPGVIRYFLERTWGQKQIDEALWEYDVLTTRQEGARYAPLAFLSGHLFANDVSTLYDALTLPVWMSHGIRGDFVDYRGAEPLKAKANWSFDVFPTGALPHFEVMPKFVGAYEAFLARVATVR